MGAAFFPRRNSLRGRRELRRGKKAHVGRTTTESRPGRDGRAGSRTAAHQGRTRRRELFLGTRKLEPAVLQTNAPTASRLFRGRPTASFWIGRAFRVRVFWNTQRARRRLRLEAARASSRNLTGTAEGFVLPRGALTPRCHCFVEPVALPSRRGERKSFWGASANVARPSRPQRRLPRQRRPPFRPRKCVWRRLERTL